MIGLLVHGRCWQRQDTYEDFTPFLRHLYGSFMTAITTPVILHAADGSRNVRDVLCLRGNRGKPHGVQRALLSSHRIAAAASCPRTGGNSAQPPRGKESGNATAADALHTV